MLGLALILLPVSFLSDRVDRVGFDAAAVVVTAVSFPVIAAIMFYGVARYPQRRRRELGLTCPHCQKALVGLSSQIVIATGRCGFCGARFLSSDENVTNKAA